MDGENEKTDKPEANIPPKLDLKQAVTPPQPKKATTRIDMAAAAMIPEEKSKTTRINLGAFGPESGVPKTIKIQRPSEASTIKLNRPPAAPSAPVPAPAAPPLSPAQAKRQTSRISLQEAFVAPAEGQAAGAAPTDVQPAPSGPKTIRIKRPGDAAGAPQSPAPAPTSAPAEEQPPIEAGPPTQRKTIKLRRPGGADGDARPSVTLPRAAADFAAAQAAGPDTDEDEPGATFSILSLVAVLVCCVMVYMLCVQALPALGLSWTGQVPSLR
jgi:hypothetical protein